MGAVVAIVGGIGSGKSVVCRILSRLGYEVYDCDSRAKILMNTDEDLKRRLADAFGPSVFLRDGTVNRPYLAAIVFNDAKALATLNNIVHGEVKADLARCINNVPHDCLFFLETAIPVESGIDKIADRMWLVTCPVEERVKRIVARNGVTEQHARSRINSQIEVNTDNVDIIVNDGLTPVLPRVLDLLDTIDK